MRRVAGRVGGAEPGQPAHPVDWEAMSGNLFENEADEAVSPGGWYVAHCDGGSRGNPGPAGYGAVIEDPEGLVVALVHPQPPRSVLVVGCGAGVTAGTFTLYPGIEKITLSGIGAARPPDCPEIFREGKLRRGEQPPHPIVFRRRAHFPFQIFSHFLLSCASLRFLLRRVFPDFCDPYLFSFSFRSPVWIFLKEMIKCIQDFLFVVEVWRSEPAPWQA